MPDTKKTVLITGCTPGGIGHALAREFHSKGLRVFATARSTETIADLASLGIETLSLELTDQRSINELANEVTIRTEGRLDILVNNAGRNYTVPALDVDIDEVRQTFEVNLFSVMRMCQVFAPLVIKAKGSIVQIGSIAGIMPYVFGSSYNASKAALRSYSDTLRVELSPFGVRVVEIVTGGVKSQIARTNRVLKMDSLYMPVNEEYQRRVKHSQEAGTMHHSDYAKSVVAKILTPNPPKWVWEGNKAWVIWFVQRFLPRGFMDLIFWRMFNLWKLQPQGDKKTN